MTWEIRHGDCLDVMRTMDAESVDAVVTDPPYGLSFMGKDWDHGVPGIPFWLEALRVLKPGGHLLAFGGTRTYHRLACAIEDAGFEIRDSLHWMYGSGFPKSLNISKALDKKAGAERKVVGIKTRPDGTQRPNLANWDTDNQTFSRAKQVEQGYRPEGEKYKSEGTRVGNEITESKTELAQKWDGWGTALKPSHEPILLCRKPLEGTVAANVEKHGVGGINVDGCRVEITDGAKMARNNKPVPSGGSNRAYLEGEPSGRWPANVLLGEEAAAELDRQSGTLKSGKPGNSVKKAGKEGWGLQSTDQTTLLTGYGDMGGASRFFPVFKYEPKASREERDAGLETLPYKTGGELTGRKDGSAGTQSPRAGSGRLDGGRNTHPTVKPVALMEWLCRLVTPPGGLVLDPFAGSGTTGIAAMRERFRFIGIELNPEYCEMARRRIEHDMPLFNMRT